MFTISNFHTINKFLAFVFLLQKFDTTKTLEQLEMPDDFLRKRKILRLFASFFYLGLALFPIFAKGYPFF